MVELDRRNDLEDKKYSLSQLKEKGLLTNREYEEKLEKLIGSTAQIDIEKTEDYKQLKNLYEGSILSKKEFEEKVEILKSKFKEQYSKNGYYSSPGIYQIGEFVEATSRIWDEDLNYGFINEQNEIVIEPKYNLAEDFSEGLSVVMKHRRYELTNKNGETVISFKFKDARSFKNGEALVLYKETKYLINKKRGEVIKELKGTDRV